MQVNDAYPTPAEEDLVFQRAAEIFALMSSPIRLRIISHLCRGELNVTQILARVAATQPNMSQHLAALYNAGVLDRRRDGSQIYYRIGDHQAAAVCRAVCTDIACAAPAEAGEPPAR
jgi:ArsR family transcriptional regulator